MQVIDANEDGNADVVGRISDSYLWVALSNGSNQFINELWGHFAGGGWQDVTAIYGGSTTAATGAFVPNALADDEQEFWQSIA